MIARLNPSCVGFSSDASKPIENASPGETCARMRSSNATASASKPGPRLALLAGTATENASRMSEAFRRGGIFQHMPGENCNDVGAGVDDSGVVQHARTGQRGCRCGLAPDALNA